MSNDSATDSPCVFCLGLAAALREDVTARLASREIALHAFRTTAGLMMAACERAPRVLLVETALLPPGRAPAELVERFLAANGVRPLLVLLGPEAAGREPGDGVSAAFAPPYDGSLLAATLIDLAGTRASGERRVLVVGDSPVQESAIAEVLRQAGIRTEVAGSADGVLETLERTRPAALLVDLDTLAESARELTARVRDRAGGELLPIVFLSAHSPLSHGVDGLRIGGDDYLVKPVAPEVLLSTVEARIADALRTFGTGGAGAILLDWYPFLRRLDQSIHDHPDPGPGDALLYIHAEVPDAAEADRETWRSAVESEVRGRTLPNDRFAWSREGALVLWVRRGSAAAVGSLAEELRGALAGIKRKGAGARSRFGIGIAPFIPRADMAQTLVSRAQAACGQAEGLGGNRVMEHKCLVPDLGGDDEDESELVQAMDATLLPLVKKALDGDGFQLVYQPILPLRYSGREHYEALLRLHTPTGAIIPPLAFLPVAERHGLLPHLDRWVLSRALNVLRRERDAGRRLRLLFHQTFDSLADPEWLDFVRDEILRLDLMRHRPILELGASGVLGREEIVRERFPALGKLGIEVCLAGATDDRRLLQLIAHTPVNCVKLARSLTASASSARLKAVTLAYRRRGTRCIATGVEDPEAIGRIWSSGVDYIQGNFIQFPEDTMCFQFEESLLGRQPGEFPARPMGELAEPL